MHRGKCQGNRQRLKKSHGCSIRGLVLRTDSAGSNKFTHLLSHGGPPEPLIEETDGPTHSRVAGELRGMGPLDDTTPEKRRDKQPSQRTIFRDFHSIQSPQHLTLHLPSEDTYKAGGGEDGNRCLG